MVSLAQPQSAWTMLMATRDERHSASTHWWTSDSPLSRYFKAGRQVTRYNMRDPRHVCGHPVGYLTYVRFMYIQATRKLARQPAIRHAQPLHSCKASDTSASTRWRSSNALESRHSYLCQCSLGQPRPRRMHAHSETICRHPLAVSTPKVSSQGNTLDCLPPRCR